jgi:glucosamine-6-phosphate deaminase
MSPDGHACDLVAACRSYEEAIATGGVDLQLLGVGADGHVGFNEPGSSLGSRTLLKTLTGQIRSTTPGSSARSTTCLVTS